MCGLLNEIKSAIVELEEKETKKKVELSDLFKRHDAQSAPSEAGERDYDVEEEEVAEEATLKDDPHRNKPITVDVLNALQWALQHHLFDSDNSKFCDSNGKQIKPFQFLSLVDSKPLNPELLALPTLSEERPVAYVHEVFGPWHGPKPKMSSRSTTSTHRRPERRNGPVLNQQLSFRGDYVRHDRTQFRQITSLAKDMEKEQSFIEIRKKTTSVATITKKIFGIEWLFTISSLIEELENIRSEFGTKKKYKPKIKRILPKSVIASDSTSFSKKELALMLVKLREAEVPISTILKNEQMHKSVKIVSKKWCVACQWRYSQKCTVLFPFFFSNNYTYRKPMVR